MPSSQTTPALAQRGNPAAAALKWSGWCTVLACVFVRALLGTETMPYWDVDPTRLPSGPTGLTPAGSQFVDVLIFAGSGAALLGEALAGVGISVALTALALIGAAGVALHGLVIDGGSIQDLNIGSTWIAAAFAGLAAVHVCRDARFRRITLVLAISLTVVLAAKGMLQVWYEHAVTYEQYLKNPDQFLASQGWLKDSAQARTFERRLKQPEATGWFGLANVYATFAAGGLVALAGWTALAWRRARDAERLLPDGWAGLLTIGMGAAAIGLVLAGSKGGATVGAIGLALLAGGMLLRRQQLGPLQRILTPRAGGLLAVALVLSAIGALMVRGAVGERVGELSLLFRWFYIVGAMRIFAAHPFVGVGPAGFKDAYMLHKPPISPEEVQSPHSIMFDDAATLGLFGAAWIALWLAWVYLLGREIVRAVTDRSPDAGPLSTVRSGSSDEHRIFADARIDLWLVLLLASVPVLISAWAERAITTPESAAARVAGLAGWIGVALAGLALARLDRGWRFAAAIGALAMALHAQIEVTPVWAGSAALFMVVVAAAAAPPLRPGTPQPLALRTLPGLLLVASAIGWTFAAALPVWRWERALALAANQVQPLSQIALRFDELRSTQGQSPTGDTPLRIAADAAALAGEPTPETRAEFNRLMNRLTVRLTTAADLYLLRASHLAPHDVPTAEARCRNRLAAAAAEAALGVAAGASRIGEEATTAVQAFLDALPRPGPSAWSVLGTAWGTRAEIEHNPAQLTHGIDAWRRAAALDPYGLTFPLRIFRAEQTLQRAGLATPADVKPWARKLLDLNTLQRLDPLRQLTSSELDDARQAAGAP